MMKPSSDHKIVPSGRVMIKPYLYMALMFVSILGLFLFFSMLTKQCYRSDFRMIEESAPSDSMGFNVVLVSPVQLQQYRSGRQEYLIDSMGISYAKVMRLDSLITKSDDLQLLSTWIQLSNIRQRLRDNTFIIDTALIHQVNILEQTAERYYGQLCGSLIEHYGAREGLRCYLGMRRFDTAYKSSSNF